MIGNSRLHRMVNDTIIDYRAVLADLESKKAAIEATIAGVRMLLAQSITPGTTPLTVSGGKVTANSFSKMGAVEAAENYLNLANQLKSTAEIVEALEAGGIVHTSQDFKKTISTVLSAKARDASSEITKVGDKWGLASWGPGVKRAKNKSLGIIDVGTTEEKDEALPISPVKG